MSVCGKERRKQKRRTRSKFNAIHIKLLIIITHCVEYKACVLTLRIYYGAHLKLINKLNNLYYITRTILLQTYTPTHTKTLTY
jgi:hypothetical protein